MTTITSLPEAQDFVAQFTNGSYQRIVALTGAGISTESGVPDFRSPGGIWSRRQPIQYQDFVADEASRLEDWDRRFEMRDFFDKAEPNAAHLALSALASSGHLTCLITQNVDGLHQRAGFPQNRLIEIHGNSTYATCLDCGARAELEGQLSFVEAGQSPRCGDCGGLLKAAVISFGQQMPEEALYQAAEAAQDCDLFLVLGSSLVVHPAAQLPAIAVKAGAELVILNAEETPLDSLASTVIRTPLAQTFAKFREEQPDIP
ncbi:SIR2 family NAD-dependent protein deacylase [Roseibium sediminicola]|uniref:protein acetyllysine N-acetyltransferase n=1 Tax=Roseibium sediminicola TaxID=2933272 RepID=A0ABT0GRC6_9HYPH|nr:Sir2 family NAD-dependent protein deacetylase [Roseibium sp. CAU 1639]MCK7612006.1 Sir2 family NAD-dependent protein deacetylase [Roseibium sp. CAU 1639]